MDAVQQRWDQAIQRLRNHMFARDVAPLRDELLAYCRRLAGERAAAEELRDQGTYAFTEAAGAGVRAVREAFGRP